MTDRPIIFSAPMVRALLGGRESQTRRIIKPQPEQNSAGLWVWPPCWRTGTPRFGVGVQTDEDGLRQSLEYDPGRRLRYAPGDRLWVRETFKLGLAADWPFIDYRATCGTDPPLGFSITADQYIAHEPKRGGWSSPIHMPRWASRLTLTVTDVRVQRLQEISEADAVAEGVEVGTAAGYPLFHAGVGDKGAGWSEDPVDAFVDLWNSLHGPDAWDANPWTVAISFTVQRGNIDAL